MEVHAQSLGVVLVYHLMSAYQVFASAVCAAMIMLFSLAVEVVQLAQGSVSIVHLDMNPTVSFVRHQDLHRYLLQSLPVL